VNEQKAADAAVPAMPSEWWIMRAPVICTNHVDQVTMKVLSDCDAGNDNDFDLTVIPYPEGVMVRVPGSWVCRGQGADDEEGPEEGVMPEALLACLKWAGAHGFDWLRFDRDADEVDGLPTFDW